MDAKSMKMKVISTLLLISLTAAGCGTLQIDLEPTTAPVEAEASIEPAGDVEGTGSGAPDEVLEEIAGAVVTEETAASEPLVSESESEIAEPEVELAGSEPAGEYLTYQNVEYGFALTFPRTWTLAEVNDADFVGPGSRSVQLSQGTVKLVIGYRRVGEESRIGGSGAPAGEIVDQGTMNVLGVIVSRRVLQFEGKDKSVFYGGPGMPIQAGGLEFAPRVDDFAQIDYGQIDLSRSVQEEADLILSSLALIGDSANGSLLLRGQSPAIPQG